MPTDAMAAIAAAVPAALSLFSAHRTVSTSAVAADDLPGAAAIAGALMKAGMAGTVVHDEFRLLTPAEIQEQLAALSEKRQRLVGLRLELEGD